MANNVSFRPHKRPLIYVVLGALMLLGMLIVTTPFAAEQPMRADNGVLSISRTTYEVTL